MFERGGCRDVSMLHDEEFVGPNFAADKSNQRGRSNNEREGDSKEVNRHESETSEGPHHFVLEGLFADANHRRADDGQHGGLQAVERRRNPGDISEFHVNITQAPQDEHGWEHEQHPGDDTAPRPMHEPADVGGQLLSFGARQEHAVVKGVQESVLVDPLAAFDQLRVHDGDLARGPAEADESQLQPESERFGKGGAARSRRAVVPFLLLCVGLHPAHSGVGALYRNIIRPMLFGFDSEQIHNFTIKTLGGLSASTVTCDLLQDFFGAPRLPVQVCGLTFPNPVGLAAGMDKHAAAVPVWEALGFGFVELGGVTWHAQPGNPAPRMFRAVKDGALINRMGFNNPGAEAIAEKLAAWKRAERWPRHPVGINLGKSKITPLEQAAEDYANSFRRLRSLADFFVVNVSSPNTPNLRQLQDKAALDEILAALQEQQAPVDPKPIFVKVAPDLTFEALDEILELVAPRGLAGVVATNTTINRPETADPELRRIYAETGGLSGRPLQKRSTDVIRHLYRQTKGKLFIMGVGGVFTAQDAWEKITAGASLLQIYTALVYEGPGVASQLVRGIAARLEQNGMRASPTLLELLCNESITGRISQFGTQEAARRAQPALPAKHRPDGTFPAVKTLTLHSG